MATPYDAPIPGAAGYANTALQAKTAYQNTLARLNQKRTDTLRQYGYLGDINPDNGTVQNLRVDPYNQYGGLQTMLRSNAQAQEAARFQAQERHLHGGLAHKAEADARYGLGDATQQLGTALTGALGGYQDDQSAAAYARDKALYEAELAAARLAIQNQSFNPADNSDVNYDHPNDNGNPSGAPTIPTPPQRAAGGAAEGSYYGVGSDANPTQYDPVSLLLKKFVAAKTPTTPYVPAPAPNKASAARTTAAAAKIIQAAKKKGGK